MFVLDASLAMAWCMEDEVTPELEALLVIVQDHGGWVPSLWHLEVADAIKVAVRRKRAKPTTLTTAIGLYGQMDLQVDAETHRQAWGPTLALSDRHGLTLYDAAYLELALRRRLPLASLDADLRAAAAREGVISLPA